MSLSRGRSFSKPVNQFPCRPEAPGLLSPKNLSGASVLLCEMSKGSPANGTASRGRCELIWSQERQDGRSQDPPSNSRNESNQSPLSPSTPAHQDSPDFLPSQAETEQRVKSETPCNLSESMLRSQRPLDPSAQLLAAPQAVPLTPPPPAPSGHPGPRALWASASLLLPGLFLGLPAQGGTGARLLWVLRSDTLRWGCDFFLSFHFSLMTSIPVSEFLVNLR